MGGNNMQVDFAEGTASAGEKAGACIGSTPTQGRPDEADRPGNARPAVDRSRPSTAGTREL